MPRYPRTVSSGSMLPKLGLCSSFPALHCMAGLSDEFKPLYDEAIKVGPGAPSGASRAGRARRFCCAAPVSATLVLLRRGAALRRPQGRPARFAGPQVSGRTGGLERLTLGGAASLPWQRRRPPPSPRRAPCCWWWTPSGTPTALVGSGGREDLGEVPRALGSGQHIAAAGGVALCCCSA